MTKIPQEIQNYKAVIHRLRGNDYTIAVVLEEYVGKLIDIVRELERYKDCKRKEPNSS